LLFRERCVFCTRYPERTFVSFFHQHRQRQREWHAFTAQSDLRVVLSITRERNINMPIIQAPYFPIIYIRGYAMTQAEIDATVATPYMGFNLGSTKLRQAWDGAALRHIFESPLLRLMKDHGYRDVYRDGKEDSERIPARSVIIYRYYEEADTHLGNGEPPNIIEAAKGLHELILSLREQVCGDDAEARRDFRVYLVAHSMGGLICRALLQNPSVGTAESKTMVDKVFTYATPHNGIEMAGVNVPGFLGIWDINNFNREKMKEYFALDKNSTRVDSLNGAFDAQRFFCLIGTNHKDYTAGAGIARRLAGELSDGLVKIGNAAVQGSPRAFVHRTHSGPFGIVNSEEGYQNLVRFLFGNIRVDGLLEVERLPLPPSVEKAKKDGKTIRASYYFECTVSPRGAFSYKLTERRKETNSAVLRRFDEMLQHDEVAGLTAPRYPMLFSAFLDTRNITVRNSSTLVFSVELAVSTTDYEIDGFLFFDRHVPGEHLFRNTIVVRATSDADGWKLRFIMADDNWSDRPGTQFSEDEQGPFIPIASNKGFKGKLRLAIRRVQ
jgi:hypothetical protein